MLRVVAVFLVVVAVQASAPAKMGCNRPADYGPPNNYPILTSSPQNTKLVAEHAYGKRYLVTVPNDGGDTVSTYNLLHLYGTPAQWGEAQGTLMNDIAAEFIDKAWEYMEKEVMDAISALPDWLGKMVADVGLDVALDATAVITKKYTPKYIYEELQALAKAGGVDYKKLLRVHMIAGLTKGHCSMLGAWGSALPPVSPNDPTGSAPALLQLRALDWDMNGPFRDYPQITVYHPSNPADGHAFLSVGFVGFVGGLTGFSETKLGISEIGASYPDETFGKESRVGVPFIFQLRSILQEDYTIDDAITRMANTKRTCDLILGVGDGKLGEFRGFEYSASVLDVFDDKNLRPANETWHPKIEDIVYWGMDWNCIEDNLVLSEQLKMYHGRLTPEILISNVTSVEKSGDDHLAYYDLTNLQLYVSFAARHSEGGVRDAYARQFMHFDGNALFAEKLSK